MEVSSTSEKSESSPGTSENSQTQNDEIINCNRLETESVKKPLNMKPGAEKLRSWLNKSFRIEMSDGRILIGVFLCTDRDGNVILGSCAEYLPENGLSNDAPRMLGLVMVPGKHIVSVSIDLDEYPSKTMHPLTGDEDDVM